MDAKKSWIATSLGSPMQWYLNGLAAKGATAEMEKRGSSSMLFYPENITHKEPRTVSVKYAVAIYGIQADDYQGGSKKAGLTFGPATGKNYTQSSKSHTPSGYTPMGYNHRCVHADDWATIIEWSKRDPYVYEQCIKEGCTHSVELDLKGMKIAADGYKDGTTKLKQKFGDGAGMLCDSIDRKYNQWNTGLSNYGGWPASMIRAVLNGPDQYTADGKDVKLPQDGWNNGQINPSIAGTDMQTFTAGDALISAFPEELQAAIVPKAVKSDTKYDDMSNYNVTTYDKLWLFSGKELYQDSGSRNDIIRANEGNLYTRSKKDALDITTDSYANLIGYNEEGSVFYWWLRSPYCDTHDAYIVNTYGGEGHISTSFYSRGVAPGFCIK